LKYLEKHVVIRDQSPNGDQVFIIISSFFYL